MFNNFNELKRIILGIFLAVLIILQGVYFVITSQKLFSTPEKSGLFYPVVSFEFSNNYDEILQVFNTKQPNKFLYLLDLSIFFLFTTSAYIILLQEFFQIKEFYRVQKFLFYIFLLIFVALALVEYFFLFYMATSNTKELLFELRKFSFIILFKWIAFFIVIFLLGIVVWSEGRLYLLKLIGFFYVSSLFVFLFHFKFTRLIDLSLILVSLGFLGNLFYFIFKLIQFKQIQR